jgi:hypothetical protein
MPQTTDPDDAELERRLHASRVMADAPETLIQRAIDLWQPRAAPARAGSTPSPWRRLVARLLSDSAGVPATALGLRAGDGGVRQLLFSAEGRDIDLRIEGAGAGRWRVAGQVLGPDAAGHAEWHAADGSVTRVDWNELAEFEFLSVAAGGGTLWLRGGDWEAELAIDEPRR